MRNKSVCRSGCCSLLEAYKAVVIINSVRGGYIAVVIDVFEVFSDYGYSVYLLLSEVLKTAIGYRMKCLEECFWI